MGSSGPADPVVVVGGGLAGMAAAARLAKAGHAVQLFEAADRLGGSWAPYELDGVVVDDAPGVLTFPAPWRDLFRKSGRPLEAELARLGMGLGPAPAARYVFADGGELVLPTERGEQYAALSRAYGPPVAARWRDLLDELDEVWQQVRPLGLEAELRDRSQLAAAKRGLRSGQTISQLADQLGEPHLGALVRAVAYRLGSEPEQTPAWCAVDLTVQRTFGRWAVESAPAAGGARRTACRSSVLVDALAARLALRKVTVHLGRTVSALEISDRRVRGVRCVDGSAVRAAAVICTVDPWQTYTDLLSPVRWQTRRAVSRWAPARAPTVRHRLLPEAGVRVSETVVLTAEGKPTITYTRPSGEGTVCSTHDHTSGSPRRSAGIAWRGFRSWPDRPRIRSDLGGLFLAGPFSPGGAAPSSVVLSGALACYACQDYLG